MPVPMCYWAQRRKQEVFLLSLLLKYVCCWYVVLISYHHPLLKSVFLCLFLCRIPVLGSRLAECCKRSVLWREKCWGDYMLCSFTLMLSCSTTRGGLRPFTLLLKLKLKQICCIAPQVESLVSEHSDTDHTVLPLLQSIIINFGKFLYFNY